MRYITGLIICVTLQATAFAQILVVSGNGKWASNVPTTKWTAPNATWQFIYYENAAPAAFSAPGGLNAPRALPGVGSFDVPFSAFSYYLNGVAVSTSPSFIGYYSNVHGQPGGLLLDDFDGGQNGFYLMPGEMLYSGSESNPVLATGTYSIGQTSRFNPSSGANYYTNGGTLTVARMLTVSGSGTWGSNVPVTKWTAPNASWRFIFQVSETPAAFSSPRGLGAPPGLPGVGCCFDIPFSNFIYSLNGVAVSTSPSFIGYYSNVHGQPGGILLDDFDGGQNGFYLMPGEMLYSGSESNPVLATGTYSVGQTSRFNPSSGANYYTNGGTLTVGELLTVSGSGTWANNVAYTRWTAPNAAWQFSFQVVVAPGAFGSPGGPSAPPGPPGVGCCFDIPFSNFKYSLGGVPVTTSPSLIGYFSLSHGGGLLLDDFEGGNNGFVLIPGHQLYSGSESNPVLEVGTYAVGQTSHFNPSSGVNYNVTDGLVTVTYSFGS